MTASDYSGSENMDVEVIASSFHDYQNIEIAPSVGKFIPHTKNPSGCPFVYDLSIILINSIPAIMELRNPFVFCDFRGQTVVSFIRLNNGWSSKF